jgi:phage anti-repressor protein
MKPTISIDATNDTANITVQNSETGAIVHAHQLKLGETKHLTMHQVEERAKTLAKQALQQAITSLG